MKCNRIVLTGGTGFLGSQVVHILSINGFSCTVLVRDNRSSIPNNIEDNIRYVRVSDFLDEKFSDYYAVIHIATVYDNLSSSIDDIIECNLKLPIRLLQYCKENDIRYFVNTDSFFSSAVGYNNKPKYSLSKRQFKEWFDIYKEYLVIINLELFHIFGPNDNNMKFINSTLEKLISNEYQIKLTDGLQCRDFIYVDDVVNFYLLLLKKIDINNTGIHHYQIGTGYPTTVKDFILKVYKTLKLYKEVDTELVFGAIEAQMNEPSSIANIDELKELYDWTPRDTLDSSIKKFIERSLDL